MILIFKRKETLNYKMPGKIGLMEIKKERIGFKVLNKWALQKKLFTVIFKNNLKIKRY